MVALPRDDVAQKEIRLAPKRCLGNNTCFVSKMTNLALALLFSRGGTIIKKYKHFQKANWQLTCIKLWNIAE